MSVLSRTFKNIWASRHELLASVSRPWATKVPAPNHIYKLPIHRHRAAAYSYLPDAVNLETHRISDRTAEAQYPPVDANSETRLMIWLQGWRWTSPKCLNCDTKPGHWPQGCGRTPPRYWKLGSTIKDLTILTGHLGWELFRATNDFEESRPREARPQDSSIDIYVCQTYAVYIHTYGVGTLSIRFRNLWKNIPNIYPSISR